jgi:hypothetical protein
LSLLVGRAGGFYLVSFPTILATTSKWYHGLLWYDPSDQSINAVLDDDGTVTPAKTGPGLVISPTGTLPFTVGPLPEPQQWLPDGTTSRSPQVHRVLTALERGSLQNGGVPTLFSEVPAALQNICQVAWDNTGPGEADHVGGLVLTPSNNPTYVEGQAVRPATTLHDFVPQITDTSGFGRHAVQPTPLTASGTNHQPTYLPNWQHGRPVVRCQARATFNDGTCWFNLTGPPLVLSGDFTAYVVCDTRVLGHQ